MISTATQKALSPTQPIFAVLGALCKKPELIAQPNIVLTKDDFQDQFHKIIFFAINNLISENGTVKEISSFDIDTYLQNFERYYRIWQDNNGIQYIQDAQDQTNVELFEANYHRIKKMTILRKYAEQGFSISFVLDPTEIDPTKRAEQERELEKTSEGELVNQFTQKALNIRSEVDDWISDDRKRFSSGDGIFDIVESLQEAPDMGYPFRNQYFNTMFGGMREGKYLLRSGSTGTGKTRQGLADLMFASCDEIYYPSKKKWISLGKSEPCLFISTELGKEELQKNLLTFITRIKPEKLMQNPMDDETKALLQHGAEVLERAPFYLVAMENFDKADIDSEIERYILNYGVKYIDFDYIQMTSKLSKSTQNEFGHQMKNDEILYDFSKSLKDIAEKYGVYIVSSTQLNEGRNSDSMEVARSESALRGAKSIADKADYGMIMAKPTPKDLKNLQGLINDVDVNVSPGTEPTMSYWTYKNRNGEKGIVIWTYLDLGTMEELPLFATDYNYHLMDVPRTKIELDEDGKFRGEQEMIF